MCEAGSRPLQAVERYLYDGNDNLTQVTDRTGSIATQYDSYNRVTRRTGARALPGGGPECGDVIDEDYDRDQKLCEAWWKTTWRNASAYRVCMDRARENYIKCD
jgi:YD repeat-containing protein